MALVYATSGSHASRALTPALSHRMGEGGVQRLMTNLSALSHPMGEGARRAGEGTVPCILAIAQYVRPDNSHRNSPT
jgi:hypothetical protein